MSAHQIVLGLALVATMLTFHSSDSEACSLDTSYASPPEVVQTYDAALAPAAPTIFEAYVSHDYEEGGGCPGMAGCGDIHALHLEIGPVDEGHLLRITDSNGVVAYARPGFAVEGGGHNISLLGYEDAEDTLLLSVAVIDEAGYPSEEVMTEAYNEQETPGCNTGGRGRGLSMGALLLLALVMGRRRRPVVVVPSRK